MARLGIFLSVLSTQFALNRHYIGLRDTQLMNGWILYLNRISGGSLGYIWLHDCCVLEMTNYTVC